LGLSFFEFDGTNLIPVPQNLNANADSTNYTILLLLPTGQVLLVDGSSLVQIYTPASSPTYNPAWAPPSARFRRRGGLNAVVSGLFFGTGGGSGTTPLPVVNMTAPAAGNVAGTVTVAANATSGAESPRCNFNSMGRTWARPRPVPDQRFPPCGTPAWPRMARIL
jgi:hypothetical protein